MKLKISAIFFPLLIISSSIYAQKTLQGRIINSQTKQGIEYANVGIKRAGIGTISDLDGSFSLLIPAKLPGDTISFSSVGYTQKSIALKYLLQKHPLIIYLNEKTTELKPVTVTTNKEKPVRFELGNPDFKGGVLEEDTLYAGRSISLLIENKLPGGKSGPVFPAYIEKARLRIFRNNLKSFKFRVRINSVNPLTGMPENDLLNESVVSESSIKNGWLEFDLSALNIEITQPFFVTFEQILDINDRTAIANSYHSFVAKYPDRIKIDTVEVNGIKEVRKKITGNGIDLAGTYIGIAVSNSAAAQFNCVVRETSFDEWKKVRSIVAATVTLSKIPGDKGNDTPAPGCTNSTVQCAAENLCKQFMDETGTNGIQISVSKKGKTVWAQSFGYADITNKILVNDSTKFRINSISKAITSVALIKLVSENKLNLDSPVQKYLPAFPIKKYPVTTRESAGHLAGFRDYDENNLSDYIRTKHYDNSIEALEIFKDDTLLFKPGTRFSYSTFGWNLIGAEIESITKENYLDYMQKNVFQPLKLTNTCGYNLKAPIQNVTRFYDVTGEENDLGDVSYKYAGGGLLSTTTDLLKFGNEILFGNFLNAEQKKILFQTQYTLDGKETGYGLGWYIGFDKNGHRIWYHDGDSFSSSSYLVIYPDDEMVISFLANSQSGTSFDIQKIGELFYSGK